MKGFYIVIVALFANYEFYAQTSVCSYTDSFTSTTTMVCDTYSVDTTHPAPNYYCTGTGYGGNGEYTLFKVCTDSNTRCINIDFSTITLSSHMAVSLWTTCFNYTLSGKVANSDACITNGTGTYSTEGLGLSPNTCYVMAVWTSDTGTFQVCRQIQSYPIDDSCGGAIDVPFVNTTFNTSCYSHDTAYEPNLTACGGGMGEKSRWFEYTFTCDTFATFYFTNMNCIGAGNNSGYHVATYTGTCDSLVQLGCNWGSGGTFNTTVAGMSVGETIYILVDGDYGSNCSFELRVDSPVIAKSFSIDTTICYGESILVGGVSRTTSGTYTDTILRLCQSVWIIDSIRTFNLTVNPTSSLVIDTSICQGYSYFFKGQNRTATGVYIDTQVNYVGCDSIITLNLNVKPTSALTIDTSICQGSNYFFKGQNRTSTGTFIDTLMNYVGCDSIVTLNLTVHPVLTTNIYDTICQGQSYLFKGQNRTATGTYRDTLSTFYSCDSFVVLFLTVEPTSITALNVSLCQGNSIFFKGQNRNTTGTYIDTLPNVYGCDSIVTLTLVINSVSSLTIDSNICQGQSVFFKGAARTTTGVYIDTLTNFVNCDSIVTLDLTVNPAITTSLSITLCQGQSYNFKGQNITSSGFYLDTLSSYSNCDSIVLLSLSFNSASQTTIDSTICQGSFVFFDGANRTTTGVYRDTLTSISNCDSVVTLDLTVSPNSVFTIDTTICQGDFILFKGLNRTVTGIYRDTFPKFNGCDSILVLDLTVSPLPNANAGSDTSRVNCASDSVLLGVTGVSGNTYLWTPSTGLNDTSQAQVYAKPLVSRLYYLEVSNAAFGCKSYDTVHVQVNASSLVAQSRPYIRACRGAAGLDIGGSPTASGGDTTYTYQWTPSAGLNNSTISNPMPTATTAGTYIYELMVTDAKGCIALDTTVVVVDTLPAFAAGMDTKICKLQNLTIGQSSQQKISYSWSPSTYLSSTNTANPVFTATDTGVHNYQLMVTDSASTCSLMDTIAITVHPHFYDTIRDTICQGQTYFFNDTLRTAAGEYNQTATTVHSCDSLIALFLVVNSSSTHTIDTGICQGQGFMFAGANRTATGVYRDTLVNSLSCDSFIILNLTVHTTPTTNLTDTICEGTSYVFNGQNLITSGVYWDTLTTMNNCDSFIQLNFTVKTKTFLTIDTAICRGTGFFFKGQNRTTPGMFVDTLTNVANCDSVITLNLTIRDTSANTIYDTICNNGFRLFNGLNLSTAGIYRDTLVNSVGCDSFLYLSLVVKDTSANTIYDTICNNEFRFFNGINLNTAGVYRDTLLNTIGCDSFLYLNLFVKQTTNSSRTINICTNQTYIFKGQNLNTTGTYLDTITNAVGCDSFITLNLNVNSLSSTTIDTAICIGMGFMFKGLSRTTAGTYYDTLENVANCDSIVTLNLLIKDTSTNIIYDTICKNGFRFFNGQILNNSGVYKDTLTNAEGCDSFLYLSLLVKDTSSHTIYDTICSNEFRLFNGLNYNTTGIYRDTLVNEVDCDSFLYLSLFVKQTTISSRTINICANETYLFKGQNLNTSGTYLDTIPNALGCDSFITLNLIVNPLSYTVIDTSICMGDLYPFKGQNISSAGTYFDTLSNIFNCDSFITLNLSIRDTSFNHIFDTICINQPRIFNGLSLNTTGIYPDTLVNAVGCDSFLYLHLFVKNISTTNLFDTTCDNVPVFFNGSDRNVTGVYLDTLVNIVGCDSFIFLNLEVIPTTTLTLNIPICDGESYLFKGQNRTTTGVYRDTLINSAGCDSFVILDLKVNPLPLADAGMDGTRVNCDGDSVVLGSPPISGNTYIWTPDIGLDNSTVSMPSSKVSMQTEYYLEVETTNTGCKSFDTVIVNVLESQLTGMKSTKNLRCYNDFSGEVVIVASNGYSPYLYRVSSTVYQSSNIISGLAAIDSGSYYILDDKGCIFTDTFSLMEPPELEINSVLESHLKCYNDSTGKIEVDVNGGTEPYVYQWDRSPSTTNQALNLDGGIHNLLVTDDSLCAESMQFDLKEPDSIYLKDTLIINNLCHGDSMASIEVNIVGGTEPYQYKWNINQNTSKIFNLKEGTYKLNVEDENLCQDSFEFILVDPSKLVIDTTRTSHLNCVDQGNITIDVRDGTPPYFYSINANKFDTSFIYDVYDTGRYDIIVRDNNGCLERDSIQVDYINLLEIEIVPQFANLELGGFVQLGYRVIEGDSTMIQSLVWKPSTGLNCIDCPNPIASPYSSQLYSLEILYADYCHARAEANVAVSDSVELFIPSAFNPMSEKDENKVFRAFSNKVSRSSMRIYNRWGEKMYESDDALEDGWNGIFQGELAPADVYVYQIELIYLNGRRVVKNGDMTLIR